MNKYLKAYRRWAYGAKEGEQVCGATAIEWGLIAAAVSLAIIAVINGFGKPRPMKAGEASPPAIVLVQTT